MVEFSETPIDETESAFVMIDHDIMRFNITMHNPLGMAIIKCLNGQLDVPRWGPYLEKFVNVVPVIVVGEFRIQCSEISVVDVLEDQTRRLTLWVTGHFCRLYLIISNDIEKSNNVRSSTQNLKNLNLSFDLLLFHRLEDFDDAFLGIHDIDPFKHFGIFASSDLPHNLIIVGIPNHQPPQHYHHRKYPHVICNESNSLV